MFTGIVEEQGTVQTIMRKKNLYQLKVKAKTALKGTKVGDSISVNGVCLTITKKDAKGLTFDIMKETIDKTTLKVLSPKSKVNLERALKVNSRLDGHFVSGHVDGVGLVKKRIEKANYVELQISIPNGLARYVVPKGSICIDGISLTVGEVTKSYFAIYLIPHTLEVTNLGHIKVNDNVNIETDILAKYVLSNKN